MSLEKKEKKGGKKQSKSKKNTTHMALEMACRISYLPRLSIPKEPLNVWIYRSANYITHRTRHAELPQTSNRLANWPLHLNSNSPLPFNNHRHNLKISIKRKRELKMLTSGLTNAPITKLLLIYTIASSIALSIFDIKYLVVIHISPHFWPYAQFWRALVWQVAGFANSTEALFAAMLVYHLRVVERAWGKRKMAVRISHVWHTRVLEGLVQKWLLTYCFRPSSSLHYLIQLSSRHCFSPS